MSEARSSGRERDPVERLLRSARTMHPDDLSEAVSEAVAELGARDVEILIIDLSQQHLRCLGQRDAAYAVDSTAAGEAFRTEQPVVEHRSDSVRIYLPVADSMRLGVLAVTVDTPDRRVLDVLTTIAAVTGELISTKEAYGDAIALTRRTANTTVAAEMRWSMLPPLSFVSHSVAVAGALEPAYDIAGDTFDYALNGNHLLFGIFDAVGHGIEASRMASMAVTSYRHSRREQLDLIPSVLALDEIVAAEFGNSQFVTAQMGELDLRSGRLRVVSAGHPFPLLASRGAAARELECVPYLPAGLGSASRRPGEELDITLDPGDAVLFYSDGITESRSPSGQFFGDERLAERFTELIRADIPTGEVTRSLIHDVLEHQQSRLRDDATLFLVRWLNPRE